VPEHVLAGDIGGTKTVLAVYAVEPGRDPVGVRQQAYASKAYAGLEQVVAEFLAAGGERVSAAAFGIAGPVVDDAVTTTNLPWRIEAAALSAALGGVRVRLMNDLETTAYGALVLPPAQVRTLTPGVGRPGNRAVIAAGTGLGQAFLYWDGTRHHAAATEGGHVDFAPRDAREVGLLEYLRRQYPRVSYERVLSGPGLVNVFRFLTDDLGRPVAAEVSRRLADEDPAAVIGEAGVRGVCATCVEALDMFAAIYGAQAGNLALTVMAIGGVYVGGGIVTKILPALARGGFLTAFTAKGRYAAFMTDIPVHVLLDPGTALVGAAHAARALLDA
jgi:glucokinase